MNTQFAKYPTDPHEDRWNRLATTSKKADINSDADINDLIDNYIQGSRLGGDSQNKSLKNLERQNNDLRTYNDQIAKQFEDIRNTRVFPNSFHRFPVSNLPASNQSILNSNILPPVIQAYHDRVKDLEAEMDNREKDVLKLTEVVKLLMGENNYLRNNLASKNRDLQKIMDTIALNDGEAVNDLKNKVALLTEENNILANQLDQLMAIQRKTDQNLGKREGELERIAHEYDHVRSNFGSALAREGSLAHQNQSSEIKHQKAQDRIKQLERQLEEAKNQLRDVLDRHTLALGHLDSTKKDIHEVEEKKGQELSDALQKNSRLYNENAELHKLLDNKSKQLAESERELKKAQRDLEALKLENQEYVQRLQSYKNELSHDHYDMNKAARKEKDAVRENKDLHKEVKRLNKQIKSLEKAHKLELEEKKLELEKAVKKGERKQEKLKSKMEEEIKEKEEKIKNLNQQLNILRNEIENHHLQPPAVSHWETPDHLRSHSNEPGRLENNHSHTPAYEPAKRYHDDFNRTPLGTTKDRSPERTRDTYSPSYFGRSPDPLAQKDYKTEPYKPYSSQDRNRTPYSPNSSRRDNLSQSPDRAPTHREVQKIVADVFDKNQKIKVDDDKKKPTKNYLDNPLDSYPKYGTYVPPATFSYNSKPKY